MKIKPLMLLLILSLSVIPLANADYEWSNTSFKYRNIYKIDSGLIDEELIDFPVLVYLNSSYIDWNNVNNDLSDLRFYNVSGNLLSHEIDSYTENVDAWLWVKIPSISNVSDTYFFLYYGCFYAESVENKTDVWNNGYAGVWHMNDNSTSTILDSTSNDNDGDKLAANEPIEATGKIGKGQDFDGGHPIGDNIAISDSTSLNISGSSLTLEAWFNPDDFDESGGLVTKWDDSSRKQYVLGILTDGKPVCYLSTDGSSTGAGTSCNTAIDAGSFSHVVVVFNKPSYTYYINGVAKNTETWNNDICGTSSEGSIGSFYVSSNIIDGIIDEPRISNTSRSSAWIGANYQTQNLNLISLVDTENFNEDYMAFGVIALVISLFSFVMVITIKEKRREK